MITAMLVLQTFVVFVLAGTLANEGGAPAPSGAGVTLAFGPIGAVYIAHAVWVWAFG